MRKLLAIALALVVAFIAWRQQPPTTPAREAAPTTGVPTASRGTSADTARGLPPQVAQTLRLIADGGPFPYDQDGTVFGNYEGLLPRQPRGYYHEYTVPTPGAHNRGTRRIITGGEPPTEYYYTADHYRSFRRIAGPR